MTIQEKYIELKINKRNLTRDTIIISLLDTITDGKWVNYPNGEVEKMNEKLKEITKFAEAKSWARKFQSKHQYETEKEFDSWLNR